MVNRLRDGLDPLKIYLFGSRARGDHVPESDYDLLLVVSNSEEPMYKRCQKAFELLYGLGVSKDLVLLTQGSFDEQATVPSTLPATVLREGKLLYAA